MSITIRKKDTGEVFDVAPGFTLEIKNTSPVFTKLGSKAVTTSLPKSPHNIRLFGYSNHSENSQKITEKVPVLVSFNSYHREGMLYLTKSYNTDKTFGITIAFNEGIMYEEMDVLQLNKLNNLPVINKQKILEMITWMNTLITEDGTDEELSVFHVVLKEETYGEGQIHTPSLNIYNPGTNSLFVSPYTTVIVDNTPRTIPVPEGYGISPFIRVWKVLELIFGHFGYKLNNNPFKNHHQLKRLCVLNNTIDAIVTGSLDYAQLLPPVTIQDFLNALYCRFGLKVFFDGNKKEVNLYLLKDIFNSKDINILQPAGLIDTDHSSGKQLKLSVAKGLDRSNTETETFEEFLNLINNTADNYYGYNVIKYNKSGIYLYLMKGLYYQTSTTTDSEKLRSSVHFDWNKKIEGLETEEITSTDEALTMYALNALYYGIDPNLINSDLSINGQTDSDKMHTDNKLAFAYDMGEKYTYDKDGPRIYEGYKYGSIFPYVADNETEGYEFYTGKDGVQKTYALTLIGTEGAYYNFFREYEAFLRHANHTATFKARIPLTELSDPDLNMIQLAHHQPYLIESASHSLTSAIETVEITARTLKLLKPYDLDIEQRPPVPIPILYQWSLQNNRDLNIENTRSALEEELKQRPFEVFVSLTIKSVNDPEPPESQEFWFLPPTNRQYLQQTQIGKTVHTANATFLYRYFAVGEEETRERDITRNIEYNGWYIPVEWGINP